MKFAIIEGEYPKIFWTPCVVHTLNLVLKNICATKNTEKNKVIYEECSWITRIIDDVSFIRVFIMNHSMRLAMFNEFCPLKLLQVADIRFASVVVMLKRLKLKKDVFKPWQLVTNGLLIGRMMLEKLKR